MTKRNNLLLFLTVLLLLTVVFSFFAESYWIFDIFTHFKIQYLILSLFNLVGIILLYRARSKSLILLINVFLVLLFAYECRILFSSPNQISNSQGIKLISANLGTDSTDSAKLIEYLNKSNAEIVIFYEFSPVWAQLIVEIKEKYPFLKASIRDDPFGLAILSKSEIHEPDVKIFDSNMPPTLTASIVKSSEKIRLIAAHPFPPIGKFASDNRNRYLNQLAQLTKSIESPVILCGDLNVTPWSPFFKKLIENSSLQVSYSNNLPLTWPVNFLFTRIPIDHCLTKGIEVLSYQRGPNFGSDHYPIELTFRPLNMTLGSKKNL